MYLNKNLGIIKKLIQIIGNYYQLFDLKIYADQGKCYRLRQIMLIKICIYNSSSDHVKASSNNIANFLFKWYAV